MFSRLDMHRPAASFWLLMIGLPVYAEQIDRGETPALEESDRRMLLTLVRRHPKWCKIKRRLMADILGL